MPPFAQGDVPWWVPVVVTLAPVLFIVWDKFLKQKTDTAQQSTANTRQSRHDTIEEFQVLLNRQAQDIEEMKKEYKAEIKASRKREDDCMERFTQADRRNERMSAHIDHIEGELERREVNYVKWTDKTTDHRPLDGGGK